MNKENYLELRKFIIYMGKNPSVFEDFVFGISFSNDYNREVKNYEEIILLMDMEPH